MAGCIAYVTPASSAPGGRTAPLLRSPALLFLALPPPPPRCSERPAARMRFACRGGRRARTEGAARARRRSGGDAGTAPLPRSPTPQRCSERPRRGRGSCAGRTAGANQILRAGETTFQRRRPNRLRCSARWAAGFQWKKPAERAERQETFTLNQIRIAQTA
jgi:hypothetical protein